MTGIIVYCGQHHGRGAAVVVQPAAFPIVKVLLGALHLAREYCIVISLPLLAYTADGRTVHFILWLSAEAMLHDG